MSRQVSRETPASNKSKVRLFLFAFYIFTSLTLFSQPSELFLRINHSGSVNAISYSPDGNLLASASADNTVKIWSTEGELLQTLVRHEADVFAIAFSPNSAYLASAGYDRTVILWDIRSAQIIRLLKGHELAVTAVTFSPNGRFLATAGRDRRILVWDLSNGKILQDLNKQGANVNCVVFGNGNGILISGHSDGKILIWDIKKAHLLRSIDTRNSAVSSISFDQVGNQLASAGSVGDINIWSASDWKPITKLKTFGKQASAVFFSSDGRLLGAIFDHKAIIWNVSTRSIRYELPYHQTSIKSISAAPDGSTWATSEKNGRINIWRETGTLEFSINPQSSNINDTAFSPDGLQLATANEDGSLKLWDINKGALRQSIPAHKGEVWAIAFSPKNRFIGSVGLDGALKIWNSGDGTLASSRFEAKEALHALAFSPNGARVATAGEDKVIRVWEVATGRLLRELVGHVARIWSVQFSPNGILIASASDDYTVRVWNANTGNLIHTLTGHTALVRCARFSPDGHTIASASSDKSIKLWDVKTGDLIATLEGHGSSVKALAFMKNSNTLASGGFDNIIHFWDLSANKIRQSFTGHSNDINALDFNSKDNLMASSSADGTVRICDFSTGKTKFIFANLPSQQWISYQPGSVYFSGSPDADTYAGLQFNHDISAIYPVSAFSEELRTDNLSKALKGKPLKIVRKVVSQANQDDMNNYAWWAGTFIFLVSAGFAVAFVLKKRSQPLNDLSRFFSSAGYQHILKLNENAIFLAANGKTAGFVLNLKNGNSSNRKLLNTIKKQQEKSKQNLKVYLVYQDDTEVDFTLEFFRDQQKYRTIPISSEVMSRSISENTCKETLFEIENRYTGQTNPYDQTGPAQDALLFTGREELLDYLPLLLDNGQHLILYGLPKIGLSSLCLRLSELSRTKSVYLNCRALTANVETYFCEILKQLGGYRDELQRMTLPEIGKQIQDLCTSHASGRGKILIILDDLDAFGYKSHLDRDLVLNEVVHLMRALARLAINRQALTLLITATRPEFFQQDEILQIEILKHCQLKEVGFLSQVASRQLLRKLGAMSGIIWDDEATEQVYHYCGGHPFLTKIFASEVSQNGQEKKIDTGLVLSAANAITDDILNHEMGKYFESGIWQQLSTKERKILTLISQTGKDGLSQKEIPSDFLNAVFSLENFGLVANDVGRITIVSHLLATWLRAQINA